MKFRVGDRVKHKLLGNGIIEDFKWGKCIVDFDMPGINPDELEINYSAMESVFIYEENADYQHYLDNGIRVFKMVEVKN